MKQIFLYFFLIFIVASCNEDPEQEINFSISGQIKDAKGMTVYIEAPSERGVIPVAQTLIEENDGAFELEGNLPGLGFYQMRIGENQENSIPLTIAPNDHMKFNTNFSEFTQKPNASGTSWAKTMNAYMKLMDEFNRKQQAIAAKQNTLSEVELTNEFNAAKEVIDKFARKKMLQDPTSPYNIILSMSLVPSTGFDYWNPENLIVFQKVASAFQEKYGDTPTCNSFISQYAQIEAGYQQYQNIQNGTITAPNFTLTTPGGKPISLADFKGKVVLIDFWASWCGPCRKESPNLVKLYQTYKGKDFVILSVSLDDDKNAWLNAIEKDGLIWTTHGSDLKGWETPLTSLYGFESIPHTVLVNQNGMIVGKGLRGELLINKIKSLF